MSEYRGRKDDHSILNNSIRMNIYDRTSEIESQINIMDHQVNDHINILNTTAKAIGTLKGQRNGKTSPVSQDMPQAHNRGVVALDEPDLKMGTGTASELYQFLRFLERRGQWLLNEYVGHTTGDPSHPLQMCRCRRNQNDAVDT